jgi:hypothetical protein
MASLEQEMWRISRILHGIPMRNQAAAIPKQVPL